MCFPGPEFIFLMQVDLSKKKICKFDIAKIRAFGWVERPRIWGKEFVHSLGFGFSLRHPDPAGGRGGEGGSEMAREGPSPVLPPLPSPRRTSPRATRWCRCWRPSMGR